MISIVDPRHGELLAAALRKVIPNDEDTDVERGDTATTVELRVTDGRATSRASMSMSIVPQQGLVIVTRLYDDL